MLAKTRFQILILPDRPQHESYAFGVGAREQQYPVPDDAVAQQRRGVVEENQIQPIARDLATERPGQTPDRVLDRRGIRGTFVVEQHRDVDIALATRGAACPASVQPGETHRGVAAQGVCKAVAEASNVIVAGGHGHGIPRSDILSVPRRDRGQPRISIVRSRRKGARAVPRARPGQSRRHAKGVNGGYTQSDVLEFAKTLTGWTHGGISTPRALEIDDVMPRTLRMPSSHVGRSLTDGLCDADRRRPRRVRRPAAAPLVTAASTSITLSRPFVP